MSSTDLKAFSLLAEFGEEDRAALGELLEEQNASKGVALFREGSEAEGLVLIVSGEVRLESQRRVEQEILGPGAALGALSLVVVGPREATAIAQSACTFLLLPRTSFRRLAEDYPRTACRLAEAIVSEVASTLRDGLESIASK
ncbi:MAG: cyclic nucleotide-binding domain-containing protein [Proteobacteria bacterium]|nr:cyclic nucleotide-binding domain-containing protein [Pseudomonadota bacterium]